MSDPNDGTSTIRQVPNIPSDFIWKRLHSLSGLFLVLFLIMHLFTNSQAALLIGEDGKGFIHAVNNIHELPYLVLIEIILLGTPFLIHIIWGIQYLFTAKYNSFSTNGTTPGLPEHNRNRAYTWQRITAWILLFAIAAHVYQMRIYHYPATAPIGSENTYFVRLNEDKGLYTVASRLDVQIYGNDQIQEIKQRLKSDPEASLFSPHQPTTTLPTPPSTPTEIDNLMKEQRKKQQEQWIKTLESRPLDQGEVIAAANNFSTVELLMVRDTFKSPLMIALYTLFVLTATYHAFNGLWTFMISWGVTLSQRSQRLMLVISTGLMILIACLGLAAIWGTYWVNLYV